MSYIESHIDQDVANIVLNRPGKRNALNMDMIHTISNILHKLEGMSGVRFVVLQGSNHFFSAGADIEWMAQATELSYKENEQQAFVLATLFERIYNSSKIVISAIEGGCYGGAIGLAAAGDFAIGTPDAQMSFGEVHLGLVPATIAPFVLIKVGVNKAKQLMLTGKLLSADNALSVGLLDEIVEKTDLHEYIYSLLNRLRRGGRNAQREVKILLNKLTAHQYNDQVKRITAQCIASSRVSDEGKEGIKAFIERRKPNWLE